MGDNKTRFRFKISVEHDSHSFKTEKWMTPEEFEKFVELIFEIGVVELKS